MNTNLVYITRALRHITQLSQSELITFLRGKVSNTILTNNLFKDPYYGIFSHESAKHIEKLLDEAEENGLLSKENNKITLTQKGEDFAKEGKIAEIEVKKYETEISENEKEEFKSYDSFLRGLNEEQKKAVVCQKSNIACIAGAGSGKTTVLTKRIVFLVKEKKVNPNNILAITFTRKARLHMKQKLDDAGIEGVKIHTFNSFCETLLRKYNDLAYSRPTEIISYSQKIRAVGQAISSLGINFDAEIKEYFTKQQQQQLTSTQMKQKYMHDCFTLKDYFTNNHSEIKPFYKNITSDIEVAQRMYSVLKYVESYMRKNGLRDFSDQLSDAITLMKDHKDIIPPFEHILIDEYQDINTIQKELIDVLTPKNVFCVGDPRQAIYGWRGSKVEYITNISGEIIYLTKNYRCGKNILTFANKLISSMELPDLEAGNAIEGEVSFVKYDKKVDEAYAIAKAIKQSGTALSEIFVIARTNKQLEEVANALSKLQIRHVIKNEHSIDSEVVESVTLATAHCAKGLEADDVYVIGCTSAMFPCMKSESKVVEYVKDYYNRREEELRLLYVAATRAKKRLCLSAYGKTISPFLKEEVKILDKPKVQKKSLEITREHLYSVRNYISKALTIPNNLILSDDDINQILMYQPATISDLKDIIGGSKANRFGKKILRI